MLRKPASIIMLSLLLASALALTFSVKPVKADYVWTQTIYIRADGSIRPSNAPISTVDRITYTLTNNIAGNVPANYAAIFIQRNNIIINGAGHTLQGTSVTDSVGMYLEGRSNVTIRNMKITAFAGGILLFSSSHSNSVSGNNVTNNRYGIVLNPSSHSNSVSGNNVTNNRYGIWLYSSSGNSVSGNNVTNNEDGIVLSHSSGNNVSGNNVTPSSEYGGIWLSSSSGNSVSGNNVTASNTYGILLGPSSYNNNVNGNNMANNWEGIYLYSSSGNIVGGNNMTDNSDCGILFYNSSYNSLNGNTITNNSFDGMRFYTSNDNSVSNNIITNNSQYGIGSISAGIQLSESSRNVIMLNTIASNFYGVWLSDISNNNTLTINNITSNALGGIYFGGSAGDPEPSSDNVFYHNNFLNNTPQVVTSEGGFAPANAWDNGYPSGGNYWSDYQQIYPDASQIDDSGIWDTPYFINANNTDRNPLMSPFATFIIVKSKYTGYFVQNLALNNTFGVYTGHEGMRPISVHGNFTDMLGIFIRDVSFTSSSDPTGAYISEPVDMGSLNGLLCLNVSLNVNATYEDGKVLYASYPMVMIPTPSWLISILEKEAQLRLEPQIQGQWDNTYKIHVEKEFDLSDLFNITIPLPKFAGGGNYTLLPSVEFKFSFCSNGTCEISTSGIARMVPIEFGAGSVTAHVEVTAAGTVALENNTIVWLSATFSAEVGASVSANFPIAGYTFDVPGVGQITIGLSATIKFDADFGATIVLAPTENESEQLISGIGIMIKSITGKIAFGAGVAINAGCGLASITGEGDLDITVHLQATEPYVYDFAIVGEVSIDYHVLFWSGTIWSMNATLYHWPNGTEMIPDPTNFTVRARYYNTSDYEKFEWTNGSSAGTAIHNIFPFTRMSAVSYGDSAYILYTDDNMSMPEQAGLCWRDLEFNLSQRTLRSLSLPSIADEMTFNPVAINLPNGTILAMWDSIPFDQTSNATGPLDISAIIPQYSCFNTDTGSWGPKRNLAQGKVATSYMLSVDSNGCVALVLEGDSLFSSNQSLVEYALDSGLKLLDLEVANISDIVSFNSPSQVAVLRTLDGSYELLNLSTSEPIYMPFLEGYEVKSMQLALNSTDSLGVLYCNSTSNIFTVYNFSSGLVSYNMNVNQSTSHHTLIRTDSGYQLVTADFSGITSYELENQIIESSVFFPMQNITFMGSVLTDHGTLVYTTENYGNSTHPLLDLSLTFIPTQYLVTFGQSGVDTGFNGIVLTVDGQDFTSNELPVSFWWEASSLHNYSYASPASLKTGEQYIWTNTTGLSTLQSDTLKILSPGNVTAGYVLEYYLNVTSDYDSPTPLSGWFENGTMIDESVTPIVIYSGQSHICIGWTGTGSVPPSGNESSVTFTITAPSTIAWNWKTVNMCDVNDDSRVNMLDIGIAARAFGSSTGDPRWNGPADVNRDGKVNMWDIALIARNFGWTT